MGVAKVRMISRNSLFHNGPHHRPDPVAVLAAFLLALAMFWGLAACNRTSERPAAAPAVTGTQDCPLTLDTTAWQEFVATGDLIIAGKKPQREDLQAFALTPAGGAWRRSLAPMVPPVLRCGNWVAAAFQDVLGQTMPGKVNKDRRTMAASYRYSYDHRALVDSLLTRLAAPEVLCGLQERLAAWIQPDSLPSHLVLACLPARPEIRVQADTVLVDTGVLAAGGLDQTLAQTLSLLYRTYEIPRVVNPEMLDGADALAEALVLIRNEGVAAFLENRAETYFRQDHPKLRKVVIIPQDIAYTAGRIVALADTTLPPLLSDPEALTSGAKDFARTMTASGGYSKLGYAMAATIAGNLGEERLRNDARTVSGFFAAYQEAAAMNPLPSPKPGAKGYPWYASVRPFDDHLYRQLQDLLAERKL